MANDFSSDGSCVALWNFEDGALATDSEGSNTLTLSGSPPSNQINYKQDAACINFVPNDYALCLDADLDAGFPLKYGDTNKKISVVGWVYIDAFPTSGNYDTLWAKTSSTKRSAKIDVYNDSGTTKFRCAIGYNGGADWEYFAHDTGLATDIWYHVGFTYQDSDKSYHLRVWDDNAGTLLGGTELTGNTTNNINIDSSIWRLAIDLTTSNCLSCLMDEVVVFNDILSANEIDYIRAGIYPSGETTTSTSTTTTTSTTTSTTVTASTTLSSTSTTTSTATASSTTSSTTSTASSSSTTSSTSSSTTSSTSTASSTTSTTSSTSTAFSTSSTTSSTSTASSTTSSTSTSSTTSSSSSSSTSSSTSTTTTYGGEMWLTCSTVVRDITSQVTVIQRKNEEDDILICQAVIHLGNGSDDLDGTGGDFEITLQFGSQVNQPDPQLVWFSTNTRASIFTEQFPLPIGETVTVKIKSPNAADSAVMVHACIYEIDLESIRDDLDLLKIYVKQKQTVQDETDGESSSTNGVYPETGSSGGGVYASSGGASSRGIYVGKC